ncbi:MAG TPA: FHA domain-containing protein [candidate division Zixibacteria bacterium]|nr:FHA domain-containing protein [candidate division Zixibacteria bacterium]
MAEIVVKFDDKVIERVVIDKRRVSIGRTKENDIVLENRGVSRKHALIEFNDSGPVVIDNESLNGTFLNNRRVTEEIIRNNDQITIGKYCLVFHDEVTVPEPAPFENEYDGTMILNTKQQKERIRQDQKDRETVRRAGVSVLVGESNSEFKEFPIEREVTTIGKAKFTHVKARGFMISGIQAKIVKEGAVYSVVNIGAKGKTKVNGEPVASSLLRNGDLIQVGKTTFRFVEDKR